MLCVPPQVHFDCATIAGARLSDCSGRGPAQPKVQVQSTKAKLGRAVRFQRKPYKNPPKPTKSGASRGMAFTEHPSSRQCTRFRYFPPKAQSWGPKRDRTGAATDSTAAEDEEALDWGQSGTCGQRIRVDSQRMLFPDGGGACPALPNAQKSITLA